MNELVRWLGRFSELADGLNVRPFVFFDHFALVTLKPGTDRVEGPKWMA